MRKHLTGDDIANDIRMTRSQYKGTFVIVEGDTDSRLYQRFMHPKNCQFKSANGKEKAIEILRILDRDQFAGVLAIVDADFWRLEGEMIDSPNLFITDSHDLETMMLASPALEKILLEWGSEDKIRKFVQQHGEDIGQALLNAGQLIGYLRLISLRHNLSLKFEGIKFNKFIDHKTLEIKVDTFITEVKNKSQKHNLDNAVIKQDVQDAALSEYDVWDVCCGHDLIEILSFSLTRTLGSNPDRDVRPEQLEKILRTGYEFSYFSTTRLYESLRGWEQVNLSIPILRGMS